MIYLLSEYGFCNGVKNSIDVLKKACNENKSVALLLPLMHNERENEKLKHMYAFKSNTDEISSADAIVFPAHGHTLEEEKAFSSHPCYDAICPILKSRHDILKNSRNLTWYYLGKRDHQETISFLSHFPFLIYVSPDENYPIISRETSTGLIVQSTMSEEKARDFRDYLAGKSDLTIFIPPCHSYLKRKKEAMDFLSTHNANTFDILVLGSKTSSNCFQLASSLSSSFPHCHIARINSISDIDLSKLTKENILLVSSTSISSETVLSIRDYLEKERPGR